MSKKIDNAYIDVKAKTASFNSYSKKYGMNLLFPSRWVVFQEAFKYIFGRH